MARAMLAWNDNRDRALVAFIRSYETENLEAPTPSQVVEALGSDSALKQLAEESDQPDIATAFEGVDGLIRPDKIRNRVAALQDAGVSLPNLSRDRYVPNVEALNSI